MPTCASASRGALARRRLADLAMRPHRLDHLGVDPQHRVERHHRVLEDHRDAAPRSSRSSASGRPTSSRPSKRIEPPDDAARRIDQADDREAGDGLARARLADQPQHLAGADVKLDAVDRLHHAGLGEEMRRAGLRTRERPARRSSSSQPRVEHVAQLVADQVDADDGDQQRHAREEADPVACPTAGTRSRWRSAGRARAR